MAITSISKDFIVKHGLVVNTTATILGTINSVSTTTGALKVAGGVGIAKDVYIGGKVNIQDTTSATNTTTGALQVVGGVGIQGDLYARNIYMNGILVGGYPYIDLGFVWDTPVAGSVDLGWL